MEHRPIAKVILQKYLDGEASPSERALVESWYLSFPIDRHEVLGSEETARDLADVRMVLVKLSSETKIQKLWYRIAAAASIVLFLSVGFYFYKSTLKLPVTDQQVVKNDIAPGGNKAYLTLADGKKICLTDAADGEIAKQAGIQITKTEDGQLVYTVSDPRSQISNLLYNTIETPKGGQFQVRLPDGTKVWLNAASSLKYPASFVAVQERRVELSGEAYFEVAKDKSHPFIVKTEKQEVEVLGTHFNINSYADEPSVKTTLLEGSVNITSGQAGVRLKPGDQAVLFNKQIKIEKVNVEAAAAWKNGQFVFNSEEISAIMRNVERWYDVEVDYRDNVGSIKFSGAISKFENVSKILGMLETTGRVHFKIDGRKITVMR